MTKKAGRASWDGDSKHCSAKTGPIWQPLKPPSLRRMGHPGDARVNGLRIVPIGKLTPNPLQPRRHFDDAALKDLTDSIREQGILQPLIVRPTGINDDTFEIVAGERRWRASQQAQVHEAPVIVRAFTDEEALAVALIENIQRDELSPLEEAEAFARLAKDFDKTQEQVAEVVGKSRSHVANMMRLLELPEDVREMLADGRLTAGHARAILRAPDPSALALQIVSEGMSVRDAETLGKASRGKGARKKRGAGVAGMRKMPTRSNWNASSLSALGRRWKFPSTVPEAMSGFNTRRWNSSRIWSND